MRSLDLTPTWSGLLPALVACLQNGTGEGPAIAQAELARLCAFADSAIAKQKATDLACQEDAQASRAAAVKAAFAEGRREARDKSRDMIRDSYDVARACLAVYPETGAFPLSAVDARDAARDLRKSLAALVAALPLAMGAF
jgi:hypothetical protein